MSSSLWFFRLLLIGLLVGMDARAEAQESAKAPASEAPPTPTPTATPSLPRRTESVTVKAIRADDVAPVTKKDLSAEEVKSLLWGQEIPVLLQDTPSMTQYSETGSGQGYSYFSLRGIQQTRVNMTFDGVPLNEPEDSAV